MGFAGTHIAVHLVWPPDPLQRIGLLVDRSNFRLVSQGYQHGRGRKSAQIASKSMQLDRWLPWFSKDCLETLPPLRPEQHSQRRPGLQLPPDQRRHRQWQDY